METEFDTELTLKGTDTRWWVRTAEALADDTVPGGFAAVAPRPAATEFLDPVEHAGTAWPRHTRATWERLAGPPRRLKTPRRHEGIVLSDPGTQPEEEVRLVVDLIVRTDPYEGPQAVWTEISSPHGLTGADDRSTPLVTLAKTSARMLAFGWAEPVRYAPRRTEDEKLARLRLVAELYREAATEGRAVTQAVRTGLAAAGQRGVEGAPKLSSVSQLILQARRTIDPTTGETFLPPTTPGRKGT